MDSLREAQWSGRRTSRVSGRQTFGELHSCKMSKNKNSKTPKNTKKPRSSEFVHDSEDTEDRRGRRAGFHVKLIKLMKRQLQSIEGSYRIVECCRRFVVP
jgi:hypothetical protein